MQPRKPEASWIARNYGWIVVFASLLMIVVGQGTMFVLSVSLKPITLELNWPREVPSLAYACAFMGAGIGALYIGKLSDRVGMGPVSAIAAVSIPTGAVLTSYVTQPWQLYLIFAVLIGLLGNAAIFSPLMANTTRWFDRNRGIALGIVASGQSLGGTIWPPIVERINAATSWRTSFVVFACVAFVVMSAMAFVLRRRAPGHDAGSATGGAEDPHRRVLGWRPGMVQALLCFAIVCCCIPMSMPLVHLVAYGSDLGHSSAEAAALLSVALAASFVSRLGGGALADRIGGLRTLFIGSAIQAAMLGVLSFTDELLSLYVVCAIFGLGYGGIIAMYAFIAREFFPAAGIGSRLAWIYLFGTFGMAGGGWLGGAIFDAAGSYAPAFQVAASVNALNLLIIGTLIWRSRRPALVAATA